MNIAVVPVFGAHGVGVVAGGEVAPIADDARVVASENGVTQSV